MRVAVLLSGLALPVALLCDPQPKSQLSLWDDSSPHEVRWVTVAGTTRLEVLDWGGSVLAIYRQERPFEEFATDYVIRTEDERVALGQQYDATAAMVARWQRDLRAGVPTARVVNLVCANLYMFLSNEADVLREIRVFGATTAER